MKIKTYTMKPGARLKTKIKPDALAKELLRVRDVCGLSAPTLLEESRPKKAVLHNEFTWDDSKAAEQWRLEEAGNIIRSVQVVYEHGPSEPQRAYVIEERPADSSATYAPVHEVLERQSSKDRLILELLADLQAFRRRFVLVSDLSHVVPVLDSLIAETETVIAADPPKKKRRK